MRGEGLEEHCHNSAARGIGLELVRQYLADGDRVFAFVRNPARADQLKALADGSEGVLSVHEMDVSNDASVKAGAAWNEVFATNLRGPLRVLQAFLPHFREGSKVMSMSSCIASSTWHMGGHYPYGASKAALARLMRGVAIDLKDRGIIVGTIHPGWVQTDMGGPQAPLVVEESAKGCRQVAADWTLEQSGDFMQWDGEPQPW